MQSKLTLEIEAPFTMYTTRTLLRSVDYHFSVAAARREGVGDAIFVHGVVVLAPRARTPPTPHDFRALATEREWWGGLGIRESFVNRRHYA